MGKIRKLASDTAYYGLSSIIGRAVNFLLVPILTSPGILSVGEYGEISLIYAKIAFLLIVYTFGLETAYFRFTSKSPEKEAQIFNNSLSFILAISASITVLLFVFDTQVIEWIGLPGKENFIHLSAVIIAIDAIVAIPFAKLRYERKPRQFAFYKILSILVNVFFTVFFLYFCKSIYLGQFLENLKPIVGYLYNPAFNADYVLISNILANVLFIILLWKIFKNYRPVIDKVLLKSM
ncbi:MAG TPA: oligosaccharide flippase family protein, partial [Ignavibacteriaceae bacterium]